MRGKATKVNETQKWATSEERLRTTGLDDLGYYSLFSFQGENF
jgi:hypothetical protein